MPIYNKLVRDRIPEVIETTGKRFRTTRLTPEEYIIELKKKAYEELDELVAADSDDSAVEELADLLEIVHALAECHGATIDKVEEVRMRKAEKRGGFKEKIFLIEVEE